ncbi:sugar phosphate isomerase/epimerase [Agriterribacter sp.]|uniref:sugar phosphate isomerase/epimerase family protein n=1 Tax=Agriterribacter sp. TaxID=2821509 RepID=UPI002C95878F|nr:sugar phosphate isomerase/epimerase [Agriterribacter sp.]HRO45412.1 sugar phosphate isomerase/epimerase [Agriterribacter sp.]HRQ16897.1 sugar phosphate isomerase/epimerase [Agriterribacter sp.]
MLSRRTLIKRTGVAALSAFIPSFIKAGPNHAGGAFRFCLNTSTIRGQNVGLLKSLEIASAAGYDGVELWVSDIRDYLKQGNKVDTLAKFIADRGLTVENAISFTTWMVNDAAKRKAGLKDLEEEMKIMAALGCRRIAAPPSGVDKGEPVDLPQTGIYYREILDLGRKYKVIPQLEFWGASGTLYSLSQALAIAAAANDPDARILPDVYHLFRGGSGFNGLKLMNGRAIEIIHMNDYPGNKPVNEQTDGDRVYPGDGVAPLKQVLQDLRVMGGTKVLSLELFNKTYWAQDPLLVAKTGLQKMKALVNEA